MNRLIRYACSGLFGVAGLGLLGAAFAGPVEDAAATVRLEPRGADAAAKATPRIVVGENYTFGYTTKCVDRKGKPIREELRVFLKGHPTTGGATAALKRKPVFTNQPFDIILRTKEATKPGAYNMTVTVEAGKRCGRIGQIQHLLHLAPKIKPARDDAVIWFFNGLTPNGYDTTLKLTAMGPGGQSYKWSISRGGDKAKIVNKVSNTAEVIGERPSDDRFDVSVRVSVQGVESDPFLLTVNAPTSIRLLRNVDKASATFYYETFIHYATRDQFGRILPSRVGHNEHFTSGLKADFAGMNWRRGPTGGAVSDPADWFDQVGGENRAMGGWRPTPQPPQNPLGNTRVYHWDGEFSVGSAEGKGVRVSKHTWQKWRDHARHTNLVTPAPER